MFAGDSSAQFFGASQKTKRPLMLCSAEDAKRLFRTSQNAERRIINPFHKQNQENSPKQKQTPSEEGLQLSEHNRPANSARAWTMWFSPFLVRFSLLQPFSMLRQQ